MSDTLKKDQNFHHPRPTGIDQTPLICNVVGVGSQYDQSWKTGNGPNWSEEPENRKSTNALGEAFFRRSKG